METNKIYHADAFGVLESLPSDSVHAVITDPPYGLAFMGRDWDTFEPKEYQEWCESWASKAKRVLRPGGHLLAFSGNRTHHRLFSGVEDAGFEIRDTITWHYGSGFPKALDVSKAIDKNKRRELVSQLSVDILADAGVPDPEKTYYDWTEDGHTPSDEHWQTLKDGINGSEELKRRVVKRIEHADNAPRFKNVYGNNNGERSHDVTAPATDAAKKWDGWKTALKPATEFVVLARKPLSEGTVAENVQEWGTGALNIDGTRIDITDGGYSGKGAIHDIRGGNYNSEEAKGKRIGSEDTVRENHPEGRYPANVIFDDIEAERLDREVGELAGGAHTPASDERNVYSHGDAPSAPDERQQLDGGGPSRYFYTSKATKAERTLDGRIENAHPTVKPTDLMEWLVKLATAEEQTILDPFAGTGTTLKAAKNLNREFIGIEKDEKWADVARVRVGLTPDKPSVVRSCENQRGIEYYDGN